MFASITRAAKNTKPNQLFKTTLRMSSTVPGQVNPVSSLDDFQENIVAKSNDRLKLIDFYATWCGPCKAISPQVAKWAEEYKENVDFYKVDVDEAPEIAGYVGVSAMPTFFFIKDGKIVSKVVGANPRGIKENLDVLSK